MKVNVFHESMLDEIFPDGEFNESRIERAGVVVTHLAQQNRAEARKAKRVLGEMLLFAIADQRCADPQQCAVHYYDVMSTAFGEPRFSESVPLPPRLNMRRRA